ncbi:hypothetical protein FGO68_gene3132 [Halteria grandinella]|uniref:DNA replication ATP-dependent helicase/nuclease n=1 Tax=Halteria grandinella TaxID=5974 RepID=A0A8J8T8K2_HALGN|nr:hypothetical protein FGO68_gene3132 [Halteria grandinella]
MLVLARKLKLKVLVMGVNNMHLDNLIFRVLELQEQFKDKLTEDERSRFVRVCSTSSQIHPKLRQYSSTCLSFDSLQHLHDFIQGTDIFFSTAMSIFNTFFGCFKFDMCILDEASLCVEPLSIGPFLMAEKAVMVGDYYILNPQVKNSDAEKRGLGISLFRKLCEKYPYDVVILKKQYRMNDHICSLTNVIAYKGLIKHALQERQEATLQFNNDIHLNEFPFIKEIKQHERKVVFINTDNLLNKALQKQLNAMKSRNFYESAIIFAIVENFLHSGLSRKQMAIVTPFVDQQALIQRQLTQFKMKAHLLDKIQGLQKDVIIVSCVQHNRKQAILKDIKRLYLSFPRASKKLIIVGSINNLTKVQPMDQFVQYIKKKSWYIDINNALQIKKYFAPEASKFLSFLAPNKGDTLQGLRHPSTCAYLGTTKKFADENKIVYHIDGVATTHTGMPKAQVNSSSLQ